MKVPSVIGLVLLTVGIFSSAVPLATFAVSGSATKCQPHFDVSLSPTSATVNAGSDASFVATVQSLCDLDGLTLQFVRTITPQVSNGPVLPPPSCYHGCNLVPLPEGATIAISTPVTTSASTPTGTYTFSLNVHADTCPYSTGCSNLNLTRTVTATLTVS